MAEVKFRRVALVMLLFVLVAVLFPSMRWFALGLVVLLALFLLISAAIWIHKLRHPEADAMEKDRDPSRSSPGGRLVVPILAVGRGDLCQRPLT
jgi:O-antigen ligase